CGRLVHAATMSRLAAEAQEAEGRSDPKGAMTAWRQVLALLPADSAQAIQITAHVAELSRGRKPPPLPVQASPPPPRLPAAGAGAGAAAPDDGSPHPASRKKPWWKAAGAGIVAVLLKFKAAIFLVLAKAKFLLLGFGKLSTLLSMFA